MSAALHKQTYTGLKPIGSFTKIKLPQLEVWAGSGVILLGFHTTTPSGETDQVELQWSHFTQTRFFLLWWDNHLEAPIAWKVVTHHIFNFVFFLIKNINISCVQKYHRWFVTNSKRKYLARSGHWGFPQMVGEDDGWRTSLCGARWGLCCFGMSFAGSQ